MDRKISYHYGYEGPWGGKHFSTFKTGHGNLIRVVLYNISLKLRFNPVIELIQLFKQKL